MARRWGTAMVVALIVVFGAIGGVVLRDLQLHREGQQLVGEMRQAISDAPRPPNRNG